jgi:2'-5' RNA ligase
MLRAIHLFPELEDAAGLFAFRSAHDPLASCIAPHVTLVFPFESPLSDAELVAFVTRIGSATPSFRLEFGSAERHDGGVIYGDVIWLPVTVGADAVTKLHDELYAGPLGDYLSRSHAYQPHMTIGRVAPSEIDTVHALAQSLSVPIPSGIREIVIERIRADERSEVIGRINLSGAGDLR